jgi:hypothetical protein
MFTIKHLVSRPFTALARTITGYRPFLWSACSDLKVVETSRYSHATDRTTGARVYMSKSVSVYGGTTVTTGEVKRGDTVISLTVSESGKPKTTFTVSVTDAKAVAATIASACMKAQPHTGERMDRSEWSGLDRAADHARADAAYTASLFD